MNTLKKLNKYITEFDSINEKSNDKYEELFKKKLKEWGIKSPQELSKKEKDKFFNEIESEWKKEK